MGVLEQNIGSLKLIGRPSSYKSTLFSEWYYNGDSDNFMIDVEHSSDQLKNIKNLGAFLSRQYKINQIRILQKCLMGAEQHLTQAGIS